MQRWILIMACLFLGGTLWAHPIKMATGKVEFHTNDTVAKLVLNFFIDDFEAELRKMYPQPSFNYKAPSAEMRASIQDYIRKNISFHMEESIATLSVMHIRKIEDNVCQVLMDVNYGDVMVGTKIKIRNTLLFSSFNKQSNILHVLVDNASPQILQFYPNHPVAFVKL